MCQPILGSMIHHCHVWTIQRTLHVVPIVKTLSKGHIFAYYHRQSPVVNLLLKVELKGGHSWHLHQLFSMRPLWRFSNLEFRPTKFWNHFYFILFFIEWKSIPIAFFFSFSVFSSSSFSLESIFFEIKMISEQKNYSVPPVQCACVRACVSAFVYWCVVFSPFPARQTIKLLRYTNTIHTENINFHPHKFLSLVLSVIFI